MLALSVLSSPGANKCRSKGRGLSRDLSHSANRSIIQSCYCLSWSRQRRHQANCSSDATQSLGSADGDEPQYNLMPGDIETSVIYSALSSGDSDVSNSSMDGNTPWQSSTPGSSDDNLNGTGPPHQKGPRIPQRWRVVFAIGVAFVLCNMDKVNMSVAVLPMSKDLGWTGFERGLVNSAFFYGYAATQIPAGWISTRVGGAKVLMAGVLVWSLGTLIAPPCAKLGILALCASRMLVGLGEGLAPSAATSVLAATIPERERARAVTVVFGSLDIGSAVGLTLCGPIIAAAGWPIVFYLFGLLGLLWCATWPLLKPEAPDTSLPIADQQQQQPNSGAEAKSKAVPWGKFLQSSAVWAVIVAHFCFNYGYYVLLAWLPSFFQLALGLDIGKSSLLTLVPYIAMITTTPFVGPVADGLGQRGWSLTNVRKLCQGIAFAGPMLCMATCAALLPAPGAVTRQITWLIVGVLSASFAMGSFARGGLYCVHQDINPRYAAALLGISNTAGALPGIIGVSLVGLVLDKTGSWIQALFLPIGMCYLFGLICFTALGSSERQEFA